ncbi:THO complex subunit 1 transcription elongation factor-domain-containing protein [Lipomyces japonicus]|uniref:THO complex subunit 1 transcription elongation factor-domain-containing protein n=1 Tax=Lipomyces japonicus TaxID=56871 RepID=UPI0034CE404E
MDRQAHVNDLQALVAAVPDRADVLTTPLVASNDLLARIQTFHESVSASLRSSSFASAFETAGKSVVLSLSSSLSLSSVDAISNLLDLALILASLGHTTLVPVHVLIEDVLDVHAIDWCQSFWPFLQSRQLQLAPITLIGSRQPGSILIRYCNAILRRISKIQTPQFSGQVLAFLSQAFPMNEKSALNQKGEFNVDNITEYDHDNDDDDDDDATATTTEVYAKFWQLQAVFADPIALLHYPLRLIQLQQDLQLVLAELQKYSSIGTVSTTSSTSFPSTFVPKWLTNQSLFELELRDVSFRRTIYIQIYLLADFLVHHSRDSSSSPPSKAPLHGPQSQSNVVLSFPNSVPTEQTKFFKSILDSIVNPPKPSAKSNNNNKHPIDLDANFIRSLITVVTRDHAWQSWKATGVRDIEMPQILAKELSESSQAITGMRGLKRPYRFLLGTPALHRLNTTATGTTLLRSPARHAVPAPDKYRLQVITATKKLKVNDDDQAGDGKNDVKQAISSAEWRGLRAGRARADLWRDNFASVAAHGLEGFYMQADTTTPAVNATKVKQTDYKKEEQKNKKQQEQNDNGDGNQVNSDSRTRDSDELIPTDTAPIKESITATETAEKNGQNG